MRKIFTKTFFHFFLTFMVILAVSCGVMLVTSSVAGKEPKAESLNTSR